MEKNRQPDPNFLKARDLIHRQQIFSGVAFGDLTPTAARQLYKDVMLWYDEYEILDNLESFKPPPNIRVSLRKAEADMAELKGKLESLQSEKHRETKSA